MAGPPAQSRSDLCSLLSVPLINLPSIEIVERAVNFDIIILMIQQMD